MRLAPYELAVVELASGPAAPELDDGDDVQCVVELAIAVGLGRCRRRSPDEASSGAVPLYEAKCPALRNRNTSAT